MGIPEVAPEDMANFMSIPDAIPEDRLPFA